MSGPRKPNFLTFTTASMLCMLTRYNRGMVIATQTAFIRSIARMTLVGKLADDWATHSKSPVNKDEDVWVEATDKYADLPGAAGIREDEELHPKAIVEEFSQKHQRFAI